MDAPDGPEGDRTGLRLLLELLLAEAAEELGVPREAYVRALSADILDAMELYAQELMANLISEDAVAPG
jgi:hypothetical protein